MMKSVRMSQTKIARSSMTDNVARFQRSNAGLSIAIIVTPVTSKSAIPPMDKSVTLSTRLFVRRLDTRSSVTKFQNKTVVQFPSRFVTPLRRRNAEMFQEPTAMRNTPEYVVQSPSHTALMFQISTVTKFPRLNVTTPALNTVLQFLSRTAERSQEDIVS